MTAVRTGLLSTAAVEIPLVVLAAALAGLAGLAGAALGAAISVAFFSLGKLVLVRVARHNPMMLLPAALGTYAAKIIILGGVLLGLQGSTAIDLPWFAVAIIAGIVCWVGAELWVATHTRVPFYDPAAYRAQHGDRADRVPDVPQ